MSVSGINQYTTTAADLLSQKKTDTKETGKTEKNSGKTTEQASKDTAAVYEASKDTDKTSKKDTIYTKEDRAAIVKSLKQDAERRQQSMLDLVHRTLGKQAYNKALSENNLSSLFSGNNLAKYSSKDIAKAKEDVSEDGYWGVKQTSDRLVSFAYALAGGDSSKADMLMGAIEKGYKQATKAWGKDLPSICSNTLDAVKEKMQSWKDGTYTPQ